MLKRLAIIASILAITPVMPSQPNKATDPKQPTANQIEKKVKTVGTDEEYKQPSSQAHQPQPSSSAPAWNASLERPRWWEDSNWWLVGIAFFTGCVICWQSIETHRAANGALLNAKAALKQARLTEQQMALMFRKERGSLQLEGNGADIIGSPGNRRAWIIVAGIKLTNAGNLPLRIFGGKGECLVLKDERYLPSLYGRKLQQTSLLNTWIRPKDGGAREGFLSADIRESQVKFMRMFMAYGRRRIILRGTFDYESHGSAWRRFYGFAWVSDSSKGEDGITKGHWVEDPEQENEEYEISAPPQCPF